MTVLGTDANETGLEGRGRCLEISLKAVPSVLKAGGKEIAFTRALLSIENRGRTVVSGVIPHATFAQERGIVHDATGALSKTGISDTMQPGDAVKWDVYDLLIAAHPGVASKVHLWGYKAVLDWWLDFVVWAEYRTPDAVTHMQTRNYQWRLRWRPAKDRADMIDLDLEFIKA
ncbi:MAG TPA: hypothetical protein VLZ07_05830 [Syntrophales bacterium]|nr:hypothetical protein [Syntrophales bacterium]